MNGSGYWRVPTHPSNGVQCPRGRIDSGAAVHSVRQGSPDTGGKPEGTIDCEKTKKRLITENYYDQRKLLRITKTLTTIGFQVSIFRANNPSDVYSQVFVYYTGILLT